MCREAQNCLQSATVNFVLGASDRHVAMVYKLKDDINSYVISIRGSKGCKVHLGRLVNDISSNMGGMGRTRQSPLAQLFQRRT